LRRSRWTPSERFPFRHTTSDSEGSTEQKRQRRCEQTNRSPHSVFEANIDHLDIDIEDGQFTISVETRESPAGRFTSIWNGIREA
jgi:hypothetical protein